MQLTPLRLLGVASLGAIGLLLGVLTGRDDDPVEATADLAAAYGITVAIPLCVLWLATSSVGDLVDDGLLVYLWLKPVARWQLPAASVLATATVVLSLIVAPLVVATLVAGTPELALDVAASCTLATLAYAGLFVAMGLWLRRALWWGIAYLLVWENGIARASEGASRLSVGRLRALRARPARGRRPRARRPAARPLRRRARRGGDRRLARRDVPVPARRDRLTARQLCCDSVASGRRLFAIAIIVSFESRSSRVLTIQYDEPSVRSTTMWSRGPL